MSTALEASALPTFRVAPPFEPATFSVPARYNPKLQALAERINADEELRQLWRCANVNAIDRLGLSDHGETHVRIVANAALRLLRLLREAGQVPGAVAHYHLAPEDAEVIVALAAAIHDLGMSIYRTGQQEFSLMLTHAKAKELLAGLYPSRERTILVSEVMQAIISHHREAECLTLEAGVLHLADALDIAEGRLHTLASARRPAKARERNAGNGMPAASRARVEIVNIKKGVSCPVRIEVRMSEPSGLAQVTGLLERRLRASSLLRLIETVALVNGAEAPLTLYQAGYTEP
jgi:metal-dependent HD superfamily phosphatase/phosphodiesterase